MIKPDLRDLINRHKPVERLNNNNNDDDSNNTDTNNTNNNNTDNTKNNDTNRGEWKIMLRIYIKCISTKSFDETHTMYPKSKQVKVYMGSDIENLIHFLIHFYKIFNVYKKHQLKEEANLFQIGLNY